MVRVYLKNHKWTDGVINNKLGSKMYEILVEEEKSSDMSSIKSMHGHSMLVLTRTIGRLTLVASKLMNEGTQYEIGENPLDMVSMNENGGMLCI